MRAGILGGERVAAGQAVARRANGFGMRVLYWAPRRMGEEDERRLNMTFAPFDLLLADSDFVSLHSPMKPETFHQIGGRELSLMKPSAFLINTARGVILDEAALVRALVERRIAGAGLDVFEGEPHVNPALLQFPNVVMTPHLGSAVIEVRDRMANSVLEDEILEALEKVDSLKAGIEATEKEKAGVEAETNVLP